MLLAALEKPYALGAALQQWRYDQGWARVAEVDAPVLSLGNLTTGGVGKTPLAVWLAEFLRDLGHKPAILSRGYGANGGDNDEARMLADLIPTVPHFQHRHRIRAAHRAMAQGADVLILDDGFQHRRLARDLDIVLLDGTEPFGHDRLLPRGMLRESVAGLARADAIVVTRTDLMEEAERTGLAGRLERLAPGAPVAWTRHAPIGWRSRQGTAPLSDLQGREVAAFCAIGNPQAFQGTLEKLGVRVKWLRAFADHHWFTSDELHQLRSQSRSEGLPLACTHKDWVKLPESFDCWRLDVRIAFEQGELALQDQVRRIVQLSRPPRN